MNGLKHQKEKRSMDHFAGLVSVKETSLFEFAVTQAGKTERSEADPILIAGLDGAEHDQ